MSMPHYQTMPSSLQATPDLEFETNPFEERYRPVRPSLDADLLAQRLDMSLLRHADYGQEGG
jgi:hypothetical protein